MHSASGLPCPFAPSIRGQYADNHSPSRSMIAVNSFRTRFSFSARSDILSRSNHTVSFPYFFVLKRA
jgi:hypothetical protein